ncbi:MAG: electron transfer flavoprotein subunit alpha/FixB family protein, partial [Rhodospirillaceae bacterium]|nr:electron transfer flavoprotein subunit alpha/FixB family protein [Rhodospirillaceae bacterium]
MAILVIAEHDNAILKPATLNTVTAARQLSDAGAGDVTILVAGSGCAAVGEAAAAVEGVAKILVADDAGLEHGLAENLANLVTGLAGDYSHVLAPATTSGKNFMPRVAATLDLQQISEISAVVDADTFVRPIYAGNALATVKSADATKIITVRITTFDTTPATG